MPDTDKLHVDWQVFCLQKRGRPPEEYEDACAGDPQRGCFAIADGAAGGPRADYWAQLLVEQFCLSPVRSRKRLAGWLSPLRQLWAAQLGNRDLPWYAAEQGAQASFLGLRLETGADLVPTAWKALAIGDCCLFHIRDGDVARAFPMTRTEDFDREPHQISSQSSADALLPRLTLKLRGDLRPDDQLWLMTDALGCWFLRQFEQGQNPCITVQQFLTLTATEEGFVLWIDELRDRQELSDDDVTFGVVSLERNS